MPAPALGNIFRSADSSTPDIEVGGSSVRLVARTSVLRVSRGALVCSRPRALVVTVDGREDRLPIVDVTRVVCTLLALATLAAVLGAFVYNGTRKQARKETSP